MTREGRVQRENSAMCGKAAAKKGHFENSKTRNRSKVKVQTEKSAI